jgi:hypothetical protein
MEYHLSSGSGTGIRHLKLLLIKQKKKKQKCGKKNFKKTGKRPKNFY